MNYYVNKKKNEEVNLFVKIFSLITTLVKMMLILRLIFVAMTELVYHKFETSQPVILYFSFLVSIALLSYMAYEIYSAWKVLKKHQRLESLKNEIDNDVPQKVDEEIAKSFAKKMREDTPQEDKQTSEKKFVRSEIGSASKVELSRVKRKTRHSKRKNSKVAKRNSSRSLSRKNSMKYERSQLRKKSNAVQ